MATSRGATYSNTSSYMIFFVKPSFFLTWGDVTSLYSLDGLEGEIDLIDYIALILPMYTCSPSSALLQPVLRYW